MHCLNTENNVLKKKIDSFFFVYWMWRWCPILNSWEASALRSILETVLIGWSALEVELSPRPGSD